MLLDEVKERFSSKIPDEQSIDRLLKLEQSRNRRKFVVLDDDPTGIQTVHDVSVYTEWSAESIKQGFLEKNSVFYLLTNSRALTEEQTTSLHRELTENVIRAAKETGKEFVIISRGDSTLRGHYPLETELIKQGVESGTDVLIDGEILFPFFKEGGRYTVDNIHYVDDGGILTPAGETEFAKDKIFGYRASNLCEYIEEKTGGKYRAKDVLTISMEDLRELKLDKITSELCAVKNFSKVIVNAIDYIDVKIFCIALLRAMAAGKHFMFRSAASFVKIVGGIKDRPLLTRNEMVKLKGTNGGMIVVGSYTNKTTNQLERLRNIRNLEFIEFNSDLVLNENAFEEEIDRVIQKTEKVIREGRTAVVFTKRKLLSLEGDTKEEALLRSVRISDAVCRIVSGLQAVPSFVLTKGGITSSDIGVKALQVKHARVLGQIRPGIPVWETDAGSKFPDIPYIIFPGNVGGEMTLKEAVEILL